MTRVRWPSLGMSFAAALCLALLPFMVGCRNLAPTTGGKSAPMIYARGVSLSPGASEIVIVTRTALRLSGRTEFCDYPLALKALPVVMKGTKPDYEKIASLAPEIVIYDGDLFSEQDIDKFEELGIETFGFNGRTISEFVKELFVLGSMVAGEMQMSKYADEVEGAASRARGAAPAVKPKVAVLLSGQGSEHWVAGTDSFLADVVRTCGGEPIGPKATKFAGMNAESFIAANPDVIIVAGNPDPVAQDARLSSVNAIKKGNISGIKEDILLRKGIRMPKMIDNVSAIITGAKK